MPPIRTITATRVVNLVLLGDCSRIKRNLCVVRVPEWRGASRKPQYDSPERLIRQARELGVLPVVTPALKTNHFSKASDTVVVIKANAVRQI
jgi:hypothetical protein